MENWKVLLKDQLTKAYVKNPQQEWVELSISPAGLLNLRIVSKIFNGISSSQRKEHLHSVMGPFPIPPGFVSLYSLEESISLNLSPPMITYENSIRTWQDLAWWVANPQNHPQADKIKTHTPLTVTFYSFKGGVGRTTALIHIAWILAMRGHQVVAVDLDLEAPSLSTALDLTPQPQYGIVDYFYERAYGPEGVPPKILITNIFGEVVIPDAPGRLFVVSAGDLSLDYMTQVDDLRARTITDTGETLWAFFRREITEQLKPDIILVDSRTGINEWGALSLLDAADQVLVFLFPNEQNRQGIDLLLKSLNSLGKLSINFVFSPVPDVTEIGIAKVKNIWEHLVKIIDGENDADTNDDAVEISAPLVIPYLQPIALADRYPVTGLLDYYQKIANLIDADTNNNRFGAMITEKDAHRF